MSNMSNMYSVPEITRTTITIEELSKGYIDESENDIEKGVYAYDSKLCVRPEFQRSFVYDTQKANAVIDSLMMGCPIGQIYWNDNEDGTYDTEDGQQRIISICQFVDGMTSYHAPWFHDNKIIYISTLKRIDPDVYTKFMSTKLDVAICKGTKAQKLNWFKRINIQGATLTDQELRNVNYTGKWLTDAKRYFSKANPSSTAKCPAETLGNLYTNKNANRQELLEQVLSWIVNSKDEQDICAYMEAHVSDNDASELWNYFNNVIEWIKSIFVGIYDKGMKTVGWGYLYNEYKDQKFDIDEIEETFNRLLEAKANKELDVSIAKICEYCITKDSTLLKARAFNDVQRQTLYNRQHGICPICKKHFLISEMDAHHKIPWYEGGTTDLDNGVMLCKNCHAKSHAETLEIIT